MKKRTTIFITLLVAMIVGMMLVYDKTSVDFAYRGIKATISGERKINTQHSIPTKSDTLPAVKDENGIDQPAISSYPVTPLKISAGDQSTVLVGNSGPIFIHNEHIQKP